MSTFLCNCISCVHMDTFEGRCTKDTLDISDFVFDRERCEEAPKCYEDYLETPEYRQEFWMAVRDPQSGKIYRKRSAGKWIGINGIDLFTRERILPVEALQNLMDGCAPYIKCTEAHGICRGDERRVFAAGADTGIYKRATGCDVLSDLDGGDRKMKSTIINCDLCGRQIYKDGYFKREHGAIILRGKSLVPFIDEYMEGAKFSTWKRKKFHICQICVISLKAYCKERIAHED